MASRMVRDYVTELYEPTASTATALRSDGFAEARPGGVEGTGPPRLGGGAGGRRRRRRGAARARRDPQVEVLVELGDLDAADVAVQVVHSRVAQHDQLVATATATLACVDADARPARYRGEVPGAAPAATASPSRRPHPGLAHPLELSLLTWAT
ncbi:MAG: hypothetical protein R2702_18620 [Acidimicrobiales bacterium]